MSNTRDGGKPNVRDVNNYQEPVGPKNRHNPGPGLRGGENFGNCGTQCGGGTGAKSSGSPGIGGTRALPQGRH